MGVGVSPGTVVGEGVTLDDGPSVGKGVTSGAGVSAGEGRQAVSNSRSNGSCAQCLGDLRASTSTSDFRSQLKFELTSRSSEPRAVDGWTIVRQERL